MVLLILIKLLSLIFFWDSLYLCYRVIELEKKRENIFLATENMNKMAIQNEIDEDVDSDGSDLDEFIDWRSKS